jgi:hypothetical protein
MSEPIRYCLVTGFECLTCEPGTLCALLARDIEPPRYIDPSFPERACDCCGKLYRGPSVYCSLECAMDDL